MPPLFLRAEKARIRARQILKHWVQEVSESALSNALFEISQKPAAYCFAPDRQNEREMPFHLAQAVLLGMAHVGFLMPDFKEAVTENGNIKYVGSVFMRPDHLPDLKSLHTYFSHENARGEKGALEFSNFRAAQAQLANVLLEERQKALAGKWFSFFRSLRINKDDLLPRVMARENPDVSTPFERFTTDRYQDASEKNLGKALSDLLKYFHTHGDVHFSNDRVRVGPIHAANLHELHAIFKQ